LREIEEMLAKRGLGISNETICRWFRKFGPIIAANVRLHRPGPGNHWRPDEILVVVGGRLYRLWRAVDNQGKVLDFLVRPRRDGIAAIKCRKKLMKRHGFAPSGTVTDKLRSSRAVFRRLGLAAPRDRG
jgi:putative transposase